MYKINVFHTHTEINDYDLGSYPALERKLSLWNDTAFKYVPIGYSYDKNTRCLRIARGYPLSHLEKIFDMAPNVVYEPDEYEEISMRITTMPRDNVQREAISFLLGNNQHMYTKKYAQILLNLAPGTGKTYITSAAMSFFRLKTMIITHTNNIREQWITTFENMTDLSEKHICVINSVKTIKALLNSVELPFKVYVVTHSTLSTYAKKHGWEAVHELFKYLKIGLKVIDEAHLFFANTMKLDMYTNCKKNIYLTATFERSEFKQQKLFELCMANVVRYAEEPVQSSRKHIIYLGITFNSRPSVGDQAAMYTMRKFNKLRYAKYMMTCDKFYDVIGYVMDCFSTKAGKIMILSSSIESCKAIREFIEAKYPYKVISEYHSKVPKDKKERALYADVICSTSQSAGTGTDIPGLRVVINTEAYSSRVTADQVSGRLREFSERENTFYVELIDQGFKHTYTMYQHRLPVFKKKCLKIMSLDFEQARQPKGE